MTFFGRARLFFLFTVISFALSFAYIYSSSQEQDLIRLFATYAGFVVLPIACLFMIERQLKKADIKHAALFLASLPLGVLLGISLNSIFEACFGLVYQEKLSVVPVYIQSLSTLAGCFITSSVAIRAASEFFPNAQESVSLNTSTSKQQLPQGEILKIKIQRLGKEPLQGVGYLEDGTMVVVNGGGKFLGEEIEVSFLSAKQTSAGKLIFCNTLEAVSYRDVKDVSIREQSFISTPSPHYNTSLRTKSVV